MNETSEFRMSGLLGSFVEGYHSFMERNSDPRTSGWFLMSSPGPLLCLLALYVWGCTVAGPRLMKNREPFALTRTLVLYNAVQVVGSAMLFWEGLDAAWLRDYSYTCQPVDYSDSPKAIRVARAVHFYFLFKIIELLDTVFFVLRKKMNQVTFLHMYHHTMMPVCGWIGTKFLPGGHGTLLGLINTLVHVIMYFYYMLAAMGPRYQKYLWWKSQVTIIQMVQFMIVFVHVSQIFFRDCNYPKGIAALLAINAMVFMYMFGSFYYRTYIKGPRRASQRAAAADQKEKERLLHEAHQYSNGNGVLLNNNVLHTKNANGSVKLKDN